MFIPTFGPRSANPTTSKHCHRQDSTFVIEVRSTRSARYRNVSAAIPQCARLAHPNAPMREQPESQCDLIAHSLPFSSFACRGGRHAPFARLPLRAATATIADPRDRRTDFRSRSALYFMRYP